MPDDRGTLMHLTGKTDSPPLKTTDAFKTWPDARLVTFLGALCMLLSAVEYAIPKPVPFMRLGLANLPVLLALYIGLSTPGYFMLVALKILTQALVSGTLFSYVFLFSLAGSLSSATVMWLLFKAGRKRGVFSSIGISLGGALANNLAQLVLACLLLFGESTRYIAPVLLIVGAVTGTVLGLFAEAFMRKSRWFCAVRSPHALKTDAVSESGTPQEGTHQSEDHCAGTIRFCAAFILMLGFLFIRDVRIMAGMTVLFYIAARIRRRRVRILPPLVILVTVTIAALLSPAGRVLVRVGSFPITLGAIETGLARALTLVGMVFLSQYATSGNVKLPGRAGMLIESVFNWFSALSAKRLSFKKGRVIETLDAHLYETYFG